ncbi:hypothetical protein PAMP_002864 [Pampus punctatissimus]
MNKPLIITVLVALIVHSSESFRMPRQAEEEEGTFTKISDTVKSYYNSAINSARGYVENVKGLKLEEKASNLYRETSTALSTYAGIVQDQLYHIIYQTQ